jgi:hypothetical protein
MSGQLAQLVNALGQLPKSPGYEHDLAPTHITCFLSPPLAIRIEDKFFLSFGPGMEN